MRRLRRATSQLLLPAAITLLATSALLALAHSAGHAQSPSPSPTPSGSPASQPLTPQAVAGRGLYLQDCAWCHGTEGEGTIRGPNLVGVGAASTDFMLRTGRMPIVNVQRQPQRKAPKYGPQQIGALDAFVASLGPGPAIPRTDPQAGNLGEGADLYLINCAACHSSTGFGGALTNGLQAPGLQDSTPVEIAEAIRLGGQGLRSGHMPKFGPDALDQHQLDSVIRYVLYLQHPRDRGGAGLAHLGPIVEGLLAWAGALLILVVYIRWLGTRAR